MAVASLITGIASLVLLWACGIGILLGIVAVVLGILGRNKAKEMNGNGAGLALGGLITGGLGLALTVLFVLVVWVWGNNVNDNIGDINSDPSDGVCDMDRFIEDPDC